MYKKQIGGSHYAALEKQPIEYIRNWGNTYHESFCLGSVLSYIMRFERKWDTIDKQIEDLEKSIHFVEMILNEYNLSCSAAITKFKDYDYALHCSLLKTDSSVLSLRDIIVKDIDSIGHSLSDNNPKTKVSRLNAYEELYVKLCLFRSRWEGACFLDSKEE